MRSISRHIMPLVINSLGSGHTYTHARIQTNRTGSILRNQARAWFNNRISHPQLLNAISIAIIVLYSWIYSDLTWYFCNHIELINLCCIQNPILSKPNSNLLIAIMTNLVVHRLMKSHFSQNYTFQHRSDTF